MIKIGSIVEYLHNTGIVVKIRKSECTVWIWKENSSHLEITPLDRITETGRSIDMVRIMEISRADCSEKMHMDIIKALTIIERKSSIPLEGENFDDIEKAYDIASECINYRIGKRIKPRKCNTCNKEDCINCNDDFNRCPTCNESLDDDFGSEPKYCPECGQALVWYTEDGFALRN